MIRCRKDTRSKVAIGTLRPAKRDGNVDPERVAAVTGHETIVSRAVRSSALKVSGAAHAIIERRRSGLKAWPVFAILVIQVILFLGHWFVYSTFVAFWPGLSHAAAVDLRIALFVLAFSFVVASLLSFRYSNPAVRIVYWCAAVWLGFVNFFFWGSVIIRLAWLAIRFSHLAMNPACFPCAAGDRHLLIAALAGVYGLINARIIRIRASSRCRYPNLPASWRGRRAVLMSDLHLGPINGVRFCRRLVSLAARLRPDVVFIPGDLFDGTKGDLDQLVAPFNGLTAAARHLTSPLVITRSSLHRSITLKPSRGQASAFWPTNRLWWTACGSPACSITIRRLRCT